MRLSGLPLTLLLGLAGFAGTLVVKRAMFPAGAVAGHEAGAGSNSGAALPAKSRQRQEGVLAKVQAFLRAGDLDGARGELAALAKRDPMAFFKLLERLPGMPGMDEIIGEAAAGLPWVDIKQDKSVMELLNKIGPNDWRDLAWNAYTGARAGVLPDEEVYEVGIRARYFTSCGSIRKLMQDAAEHRPESFMELLNRKGGTSIREEFVEEAMKHDPSMGAKLFSTIPDGSDGANYDRAYVLQVRSRVLPTAENLVATMEDIGERGIYSGDFGALFTDQAYSHATPEERGKILETIGGLPALARNRMLMGPLGSGMEMGSAEFCEVVGLLSSGFVQQNMLGNWIGKHPELDEEGREWIAGLPTEKLRVKAAEILDERKKGKE